ncbi:MAG: MFS transporter [Hyphomonadaceae bacterium]|nr:MFS transporter [Hyphomonadaceae bacterium]
MRTTEGKAMQVGADIEERANQPAGAREETNNRWYILAVLTLIATLNSIDKHLVPALALPIKTEFMLSDAQFGLVVGLIYSLGFLIGGIPLTLIVDRVNRARLLALLLATWSGATALATVVTSYAQLAAARFIVGAAEVGGTPISMALIADQFQPERRGTAIGIWTTSRSVSLLVSFALGGYIAVHWGWRAAFLMAGVPGLILSVVVLLTFREAPSAEQASAKQAPTLAFVREFIGNRQLLLLAGALILGVACQNGVMAFLTAFLGQVHGQPLDRAGALGGIILGLGAGIGMPLGGVLTDILGNKSVRRQYAVAALLMFAAALAALIGLLAPNLLVATAGLFVFETSVSCAYTAGLCIYLNVGPADKRASMMSMLTILIIFCGSGLGPPLAGLASDTLQSLRWGLCATVFLMILSGALIVLAQRSHRRGTSVGASADVVEQAT